MEFEEAIKAFIEKWNYKPTEFGRRAIGDPNFVQNIKDGRSPSLKIARRVEEFMAKGPEVHSLSARRRKKPKRVGAIAWSASMDKTLEGMIKADSAWAAIGREIGVSRLAARRRAVKLGYWEMPEQKEETP